MIYPASLNDIDDIMEIEHSCFPKEGRFTMRQMRYLISRARAHFHVYKLHGQTSVAYSIMLTTRRNRYARLYSLAVLPIVRGRGFAKNLLQFSERLAEIFEYKGITLEVQADNKKAISFYEHLGYIYQHTKPLYYGDGLDAAIYKKDFHAPQAIDHSLQSS